MIDWQDKSQTPFGFRGGGDRHGRLHGCGRRPVVSNAFWLPWRVGCPCWPRRVWTCRCSSQTPFGFRGGLDELRQKSVSPLICSSLKRLSALGAGWISQTIWTSSIRRTGGSQTPFGFGGGLDFTTSSHGFYPTAIVSNAFRLWGRVGSKKMRNACDVMNESQTPFGFGGGLDLEFIFESAAFLGGVSNAFRLWGRVGFWSRLPGMRTRTVCLKRLSALGAGWITAGNRASGNRSGVSNAFRLWGRVGSQKEVDRDSGKVRYSLKRLSALGAGWICRNLSDSGANGEDASQTPFGFGGGLDKES